MTRFLARRLLNYIVLLALASFLTFTLTSLTFTPLNSLQQRNPRPPQAVIDAKAAELDLDKPIPLRYAHWVCAATSARRSTVSRFRQNCGDGSA